MPIKLYYYSYTDIVPVCVCLCQGAWSPSCVGREQGSVPRWLCIRWTWSRSASRSLALPKAAPPLARRGHTVAWCTACAPSLSRRVSVASTRGCGRAWSRQWSRLGAASGPMNSSVTSCYRSSRRDDPSPDTRKIMAVWKPFWGSSTCCDVFCWFCHI